MQLRFLRTVFLKGLFAVLPIAVTIIVIVWLVSGFESLIRPILLQFLSEEAYFPGLGVIVGVAFIFLVGLSLQALSARKAWSLGEMLLSRMPLVSQIYRALKQIVSYASGSDLPKGAAVAMVRFPGSDTRMLGVVTKDDLDFDTGSDLITVFLPWSYQIGGITVIVPRDSVEPVDLSPSEALQFSLTAGAATEPRSERSDPRAPAM